jgi:hypothetical protein
MRETWYVLEDGELADPRDVVTGDRDLLYHKDGRPVAYREHGPRSRGVDPEEERAKAVEKRKAAKAARREAEEREAEANRPAVREAPAVEDRELTAERPPERVKRPYKTRFSRVR